MKTFYRKFQYVYLFGLFLVSSLTQVYSKCTIVPNQNTVYGTVFTDANQDGALEVEIATIGIDLYQDNNGNGIINTGEPIVTSGVSNTNGNLVSVNVLSNDTDGNNPIDTNSLTIVAQPLHGSVAITSTGEVIYVPNSSFFGTDSFTYEIL